MTARAASGQHCDAPEWSGDDIELWGAGDPEGLANAAGSVQYAYEAADEDHNPVPVGTCERIRNNNAPTGWRTPAAG